MKEKLNNKTGGKKRVEQKKKIGERENNARQLVSIFSKVHLPISLKDATIYLHYPPPLHPSPSQPLPIGGGQRKNKIHDIVEKM